MSRRWSRAAPSRRGISESTVSCARRRKPSPLRLVVRPDIEVVRDAGRCPALERARRSEGVARRDRRSRRRHYLLVGRPIHPRLSIQRRRRRRFVEEIKAAATNPENAMPKLLDRARPDVGHPLLHGPMWLPIRAVHKYGAKFSLCAVWAVRKTLRPDPGAQRRARVQGLRDRARCYNSPEISMPSRCAPALGRRHLDRRGLRRPAALTKSMSPQKACPGTLSMVWVRCVCENDMHNEELCCLLAQ